MKSYNEIIFEALESSCLSEGGDGDSALICKLYREAADQFERWLKIKEENDSWKNWNYAEDKSDNFH